MQVYLFSNINLLCLKIIRKADKNASLSINYIKDYSKFLRRIHPVFTAVCLLAGS
jgi:hypothetical protein